MTVESVVTRQSLNCSNADQKFSYTFSDIKHDATDSQIYNLARILNSAQEVAANKITRTKTTMLTGIE